MAKINYRKYSDFDATFAANPVTGDLALRTDENAVKFAIKNIVLTRNFERPFNSSIGSQIKRYLFEPMDDTTLIVLKKVISESITRHEPRVELINIVIDAKPDNNQLSVTIFCKLLNSEKPFNVNITLDRTR